MKGYFVVVCAHECYECSSHLIWEIATHLVCEGWNEDTKSIAWSHNPVTFI